MPRLTLLLLLFNYLLVVCAGLVERPDRPVSSPADYAHSADCQLKNEWRGGDCYDDCNGVQYRLNKGHEPSPWHHVLTSMKGLDLHHLPVAALVAEEARFFAGAECLADERAAGVPSGVSREVYAPPRRA